MFTPFLFWKFLPKICLHYLFFELPSKNLFTLFFFGNSFQKFVYFLFFGNFFQKMLHSFLIFFSKNVYTFFLEIPSKNLFTPNSKPNVAYASNTKNERNENRPSTMPDDLFFLKISKKQHILSKLFFWRIYQQIWRAMTAWRRATTWRWAGMSATCSVACENTGRGIVMALNPGTTDALSIPPIVAGNTKALPTSWLPKEPRWAYAVALQVPQHRWRAGRIMMHWVPHISNMWFLESTIIHGFSSRLI